MKKVLVDFKAYCSVVVELNDDEDEDVAIERAQEYLEINTRRADWEFDNNVEETENDPDVKLGDDD